VRTGRRGHGLVPLSISGGGKWLAVGAEGLGKKLTVALWDMGARREVKAFEVVQDRLARVALSPDGKVLATWGNSYKQREEWPAVQLWDVLTGKKRALLEGAGPQIQNALFSPDGKHLLMADAASVLSIWNVTTGKQIRRLEARQEAEDVLAWSPDG